MKNKYFNNSIRAYIFVAISFLSLTLFANDIYVGSSYSHASEITNIEAIYQPELPKVFQLYTDSFSPNQRQAYGSFYLENYFKSLNKMLLSDEVIWSEYLSNQSSSALYIHHIISILQKSNTWHQSSDEDPPRHDIC